MSNPFSDWAVTFTLTVPANVLQHVGLTESLEVECGHRYSIPTFRLMPASMPIRKIQRVYTLRAGLDKGGVGGVVEGVEGLAVGEDVAAEGFHFAAGGGVGDDDGGSPSRPQGGCGWWRSWR